MKNANALKISKQKIVYAHLIVFAELQFFPFPTNNNAYEKRTFFEETFYPQYNENKIKQGKINK